MQDDQKRPTVEDQELANMIANLGGGAPQAAPAPSAAPNPTSSLPPIPPKPAENPVQPLPPIPPAPNNNPTPSQTAPAPQPAPTSSVPVNTNPPKPTDNFKELKPTPGLPPLPSNPSANQPSLPPIPPISNLRPVSTNQPSSDLSAIKQKTLNELRPLVAKLDLSPEERFNTLLLLIRTTDDKSLIPQAYDAAEKITNEAKRASALLDIVKEIDFFENN